MIFDALGRLPLGSLPYEEGQTATDHQAVYLEGAGFGISNNQPIYLSGQGGVSVSLHAYLAGKSTAQDSQPIYIFSHASVLDSQPCYLPVLAVLADNQPIFVQGKEATSDHQPIYVLSGQSVSDHQPVYLSSLGSLFDHQPVYLFGGTTSRKSLPVYLNGASFTLRIVDTDTQNAITLGAGYKLNSKLLIEPTWMHFDYFTSGSDAAPGFADEVGVIDNPAAQDITFIPSNNNVVTFYIDSGSLKYQVEGSSNVVTVASASGKPGLYSGYIFFINGSSQLVRYALDFSAIVSESSNPFSGGATTIDASVTTGGIVHGISDTACVLMSSSEGGVKTSLYIYEDSSWNQYDQPNRFMFPLEHDYTSGSPSEERSFYSFAIFSGAAMLDGNAFAYLSNALTGSVQGIRWDSTSKAWSDIYVAVASDIEASICEFRVANCYAIGSTIYMAGQFKRNENVDDDVAYTMILRSTDGRVFSMDRFGLVSDLGYRMLAGFYNEDLHVASCNRISRQDATWIFGGTTLSLEVPQSRISSITDTDLSRLDVSLGNASELYSNNTNIEVGSKVTLYLAYETVTSGSDYYAWGTYFIDAIPEAMAEGERTISIQAVNQAMWQLQGMSSPYYSEILSKSSVRDDLDDAATTQLSVAEMCGYIEDEFSVDFWESEEFVDGDLSIDGANFNNKGGVNFKRFTGAHNVGVKTRDLKEELVCAEYPTFTSGSATFNVFGWSFTDSGSDNDDVQMAIWTEDEDGNESLDLTTKDKWPCTYEEDAAGNYPIVFVVAKPVGTKITKLGLVFSNTGTAVDYPCRIDCVSGVNTFYRGTQGNSGWYSADDKLWKVRSKCVPNIMFARNPYDTFNFQIEADFEEDVTGYVAGYGAISYGLVGLAEDGRNYIAARYNKITDKIEIVKARESVETVLANATPATDVTGGCSMMFLHKDGHFEVYIKDASDVWVKELSYDWLEADGWMFTGESAAKHVGIYGYINVPYFRITGLNEGGDPDIDKAQGIPALPGWSAFDSFPSSGSPRVDIGDRIYAYDGKVEFSSGSSGHIRGPFQYRQHDEYVDPYGDGWGLECRDHDRSLWNGAFSGMLLGVDDGYVYVIEDSDWTIWDRQDGVTRQLPGRARFYLDEDMLKKAYHTLSNRCYITEGLALSYLWSGESQIEAWGDICYYHVDGDIQCNGFRGSSGDIDATIEDLVERIARSSGASIVFPGDYVSSSLGLVAGTPNELVTIPYTEGFDLHFSSPALTGSAWIAAETNATLAELYPSSTGIRVKLLREGVSTYNLQIIALPSSIVDQYRFTLSDEAHSLRFLFHDNFMTVYIDDIWAHTFHPGEVTWSTGVGVYAVASGNITISDVRVPELCDWREAIYIDLETDGMAAIGSIIQERPVETYARYDGSIKVWYDPTRTTYVQAIYPRRHQWTRALPKRAASDAIVYFSDVKTLLNNNYRDAFGFATKVYRMPNLEVGAIRAAYLQLKNFYRERLIHDIQIRPDVRLEPGDKLSVSYTATGTGAAKSFTLTIDTMGLRIVPDNSAMQIQGREV